MPMGNDVRTWQYFSGICPMTREQRVFRHPSETHGITLNRHKGLRARVTAEDRAFDIRGHGSFLWPSFSLVEQDHLHWRLSVRSPLRNTYALETASSGPWRIKTPLFNVLVSGQSGDGASLEGCIARTRDQWVFSFDGIEPPTELVVAVAFVHRLSYFHT
jgi:hypothetical protein